MTFFCKFALLLFASSVKFWPILYNELYNLPMGCVEKIFPVFFEYPCFRFCSVVFFSSALEKVTTVVNYLFRATSVIYFPDLNHASLLLIQNLMYPYIWIMVFFFLFWVFWSWFMCVLRLEEQQLHVAVMKTLQWHNAGLCFPFLPHLLTVANEGQYNNDSCHLL